MGSNNSMKRTMVTLVLGYDGSYDGEVLRRSYRRGREKGVEMRGSRWPSFGLRSEDDFSTDPLINKPPQEHTHTAQNTDPDHLQTQ